MDLNDDVQPPSYLVDRPRQDLSHVFKGENNDLVTVDVLESWLENIQSSLDNSQIEALQRILTKKLAIVQGPPGTYV